MEQLKSDTWSTAEKKVFRILSHGLAEQNDVEAIARFSALSQVQVNAALQLLSFQNMIPNKIGNPV